MGWQAYVDLLAVGYRAGEVEGGEVHTAEGPAGEGEYVGYAGAGRGVDEAGAAYLSGYVHDQLRSGRGCGPR